jgi:hypothetical protein
MQAVDIILQHSNIHNKRAVLVCLVYYFLGIETPAYT